MRASLDPEKAKTGGGSGPEKGNYEVISAASVVRKSDFRETPNLAVVLHLAVLDKDGDRVRGADDVTVDFGLGNKSLEAFHPGKTSGRTGDVEDLGVEIDTEGNTIFCDSDTAQFNSSTAMSVFTKTLKNEGFPADVLDACYLPDFVGMKFSLDTLPAKIINEKYKTRLNEKPMKRNDGTEQDVTYKVCTKWLNPNYLSSPSKATGKAKESAAAPKEAATNEDILRTILTKIAAERPGEKGIIPGRDKLKGFVTNHYVKTKPPLPPKQMKSVQELVMKAGGACDDICADLGCMVVEQEDKSYTFQFPEAE